ncbi:MAG: glycosyltransferase family 4 protein [Phycisphaerales bacterium]
MRMALFTDTLGDVNGVARFIGAIAADAQRTGTQLLVVTSTRRTVPSLPNIVNVPARAAARLPKYPELEVVWPRRGEMLRRVADFAPDVVHVSTPGPVGVAGRGIAQRLGAALVGTYHTDFPAYVGRLTGSGMLGRGAGAAMKWFYGPFDRVLVRSASYIDRVAEVGIARERAAVLQAGVDLGLFSAARRTRAADDKLVRFIYVGRVSEEKGVGLLAAAWRAAQPRLDGAGIAAELVIVGDGPARPRLARELARTRSRLLGYRFGEELAREYADGDVFVFPSATDTLGQVVMEAQASGLPALVSNRGGPQELVRDGETGIVLSANDERAWAAAMLDLAQDHPRRQAMGRAAAAHMADRSFTGSVESFWALNAEAARLRNAALGRGAGWSITSRPSGAAGAVPGA